MAWRRLLQTPWHLSRLGFGIGSEIGMDRDMLLRVQGLTLPLLLPCRAAVACGRRRCGAGGAGGVPFPTCAAAQPRRQARRRQVPPGPAGRARPGGGSFYSGLLPSVVQVFPFGWQLSSAVLWLLCR